MDMQMKAEFFNKKELRKKCNTYRNNISKEEASQKSLNIKDKLSLLPDFYKSSVIMSYVSIKNEVDTHSLIKQLIDDDKTVCVPYCIAESTELLAIRIKSFDDLVPRTLGILEPVPDRNNIINPSDIDAVIIPGAAFDKGKNRLGMGAGYYDRFLPRLRTDAVKIALAYDFQILEALPFEEHDIPMDYIVTNLGIIY